MTVGQHFIIDFDNGDLTSSSDGSVLTLNFGSPNVRFEFLAFSVTDTYAIRDGDSASLKNTFIPLTDEGLTLDFTLTGLDTYSLDVTVLASNSTTTITGTLDGVGTGMLTDFRLTYASDSGGAASEFFVNSIAVTPIPQPAAVLGGGAVLGLLALRRW